MKILKDPLYRPQAERMSKKDPHGYIQGVVQVELNDIIDGDLEAFMDLLSNKLTGTDVLENIEYRVVGHQAGSVLLIEVRGDPSSALEFMEDGPGPREWSPRSKENPKP